MSNFFSVRIETLGCRLNQVESEALAVRFAECGFDVFSKEAETSILPVKLCIVNTCTVTGKAEQKARRLIRLLLKEHEESVILVTGCYAELEADSIEKINKQKNYYNNAFDTKANINSIDTDDINIGRYIFTAEPT